MKKILFFFLICFCAIGLYFGLTSCNGETNNDPVRYESNGLQLELSDDMTYFIVAGIGTCTDVDLFIPNEYNGLPVKKIKERAFAKIQGYNQ